VTTASIVFVVDDDASVRSSLKFLLSTVGLQVESFGSADTFLHRKPPDAPSCLVLDVRLPGVSGLDFQTELAKANVHIPTVEYQISSDDGSQYARYRAGQIDLTDSVPANMLPALRAAKVAGRSSPHHHSWRLLPRESAFRRRRPSPARTSGAAGLPDGDHPHCQPGHIETKRSAHL